MLTLFRATAAKSWHRTHCKLWGRSLCGCRVRAIFASLCGEGGWWTPQNASRESNTTIEISAASNITLHERNTQLPVS